MVGAKTKATFICHVVSQKAYLHSGFPGNSGYTCLFQTAILGWFSESKEYKISLYYKVQMNSVSAYFKPCFTGKIRS
jgi:hypothetical protein